MSTLAQELSALKTAEDKITGNKVANFAYDDYAYEHDDANGVDTYNVNNHQNVPNGTANILKVNATILTKGWRAQASAITRMLINHFLGRCSYNLNKVNDHFSTLLTKLMSFLEAPNGIATLNSEGKVTALDNVVNTGNSNIPVENGTTKFTSGGAYDFFGSQTNSTTWLHKVFSWVLGNLWRRSSFYATNIPTKGVVYYANGLWVACTARDGNTELSTGLWWSTNGKSWTQGTGDMSEYIFVSVHYADNIWVAGSKGHGLWWSADGKSWTQGTGSNTSYTFNAVYYGNDIWVAGSKGHGLWWSADGKSWTQGTGSNTSYTFNAVYYGNDIWVAGSSNYGLWWSADGKSWTQGTGAMTSYTISALCYGNGVWLTGTSGNHGAYYSTDGKSWTAIGSFSGKTIPAIGFGNNRFITTAYTAGQTTTTYGLYSVYLYSSSSIASDWLQTDVTSDIFSEIMFVRGKWFALNNSSLMISGDGRHWQNSLELPTASARYYPVYNIAYGDNKLLSIAQDGIWYSDYSIALED